MKKFSLFSVILIAGMAQAATTAPMTGIIESKLSMPVKPVKEKGVYVIPKTEKSENVNSKWIPAPEKIKRNNPSDGSQTFVLDSLIGRMESGDYTIKEAYIYDNNGNSKEARMFYWDYDANNWQMSQEILLEWNDENLCTSSINKLVNPWGDDSVQKMLMEYDENGFNTAVEIYNLEAGEWVPAEKHIYKYDSYGYMSEELTQIPGENSEWTDFSKNIAEWTPSGLRTLFEFYLWDGDKWYYADSRLVYEYDDQGRVLSSVEQIPMGDEVQNFLRVLQTFGPYGIEKQTYEFWNQDNENWLGYENNPSMYSDFIYDESGRVLKETGYFYNFDISDWTESISIESEYTAISDDITREVRIRYDILAGNNIANKIEREYNRAGNDTYFKEWTKDYIDAPLMPYEENFFEYDKTGTKIVYGENYGFEGDLRIALIKQSTDYDEDGNPMESWFWNGKYLTTGEGDPEEWVNYTHFIYEYENNTEISRMAYIWENDEYVSFWGEDVNLNFDVPINQCIYWMNAEMKYDYQIMSTRKYRPDGKGFTYEEGVWHYSPLVQVGVNTVEASPVKVYPNPATDYIHVDCEEGSEVNIYSMQGNLVMNSNKNT